MTRPDLADGDRGGYEASTDARVERSRAAALAAARQLLLEEGWAAMTHLRVAELAGLHRATVYRHWPTVVSLLLDVLLNESKATIPTPIGDLDHDLMSGLRALRDDLVDRGLGSVLATLVDRAEVDEEIHAVKLAIVSEGLGGIRMSLVLGSENGQIPSDLDPDVGVAQLFGPILYRRLLSAEPIPDSFIRTVVDGFKTAYPPPARQDSTGL
jgi:AcrR family transcriptional regulator